MTLLRFEMARPRYTPTKKQLEEARLKRMAVEAALSSLERTTHVQVKPSGPGVLLVRYTLPGDGPLEAYYYPGTRKWRLKGEQEQRAASGVDDFLDQFAPGALRVEDWALQDHGAHLLDFSFRQEERAKAEEARADRVRAERAGADDVQAGKARPQVRPLPEQDMAVAAATAPEESPSEPEPEPEPDVPPESAPERVQASHSPDTAGQAGRQRRDRDGDEALATTRKAVGVEHTDNLAVEVAEALRQAGLLRDDGSPSWRLHLVHQGKPDVQAIVCLADICQWHRPATGRRSRTHFNGDRLDLSNKHVADVLRRHNLSDSAKTAQRVIRRLHADYQVIIATEKAHGPPRPGKPGGTTRWIEMDPKRLLEITHPVRVDPVTGDVRPDTSGLRLSGHPNTGNAGVPGAGPASRPQHVDSSVDLGLDGFPDGEGATAPGTGTEDAEHRTSTAHVEPLPRGSAPLTGTDVEGERMPDGSSPLVQGRQTGPGEDAVGDDEAGGHAPAAGPAGDGEVGHGLRSDTGRQQLEFARSTARARVLMNLLQDELKWIRTEHRRRWVRTSTPEYALLRKLPDGDREALIDLETQHLRGRERELVRRVWALTHSAVDIADAVYQAFDSARGRGGADMALELIAAAVYLCGKLPDGPPEDPDAAVHRAIRAVARGESPEEIVPTFVVASGHGLESALIEFVAEGLTVPSLRRHLAYLIGLKGLPKESPQGKASYVHARKRAEKDLWSYTNVLWSKAEEALAPGVGWRMERTLVLAEAFAAEAASPKPSLESFHDRLADGDEERPGLDPEVRVDPKAGVSSSLLYFLARKVDGHVQSCRPRGPWRLPG